MVLSREQKSQKIEEYSFLLKEGTGLFLGDFRGLSTRDLQDLRDQLSALGSKLAVVKNTLFKKALEKVKMSLPEGILNRPLIAIWVSDEGIGAAKALATLAQNTSLEILGGVISGEFVPACEIETLAKLPGREVLEGRLVGTLAAPLTGLSRVLGGNLFGLVNILKQLEVVS